MVCDSFCPRTHFTLPMLSLLIVFVLNILAFFTKLRLQVKVMYKEAM